MKFIKRGAKITVKEFLSKITDSIPYYGRISVEVEKQK